MPKLRERCPKCKKGHLQRVGLPKPANAIAAAWKKVCPRCKWSEIQVPATV